MAGSHQPNTSFLTLGAEGIVINPGNPDIGQRHHVVHGGITTNLLQLPGAAIVPRGDRPGLYADQDSDTIRWHTDFDLDTRDLASPPGAGKSFSRLDADGIWSDLSGQIKASRVLVRVN